MKKRIATQARSAAPHRGDAPQTPIRLPSGSVIAGSFAAAVLSALAVGRLRRRHAYRYPPPEPGRDFTSEPLGPTLRQLAQAVSNNHHPDEGYDTALDSVPFPVLPFDDPERRQHPGRIDIGTRNGEIITAEITALSGIAVTGPASDDIARAVIAGLRVRAGPSAAEVLLTSDLAERLLPDLASEPAIRRAENAGDMARAIEVEMIARTRRLAAAEASDAASYRVAVPEDPLPVVVAVLADLPEDSVGRWSALLADAHRLDIAVLFLAANRAATGRLITDASRAVTEVTPDSLAEQLFGAQLFGLRAPEAVDLLCAVADSYAGEEPEIDDSEDGEPLTVQRASDHVDEPHSPAPSPAQAEQWPQQSRPSAVADRPIVVQVLGPYRITAHGEAVSTGLRTRAKALLAWYLIRPEGATSDEAVDALWPDTPPERVQRQFWYGLGDLRARLRGPDGEALDILIKSGERYQSSTGEVVCDLWDFQHALADAARADNDDDTRAALRRAVDIYRGDLLQGCEYLWVEPVRQDLHRRALDAHLRLAEHEKHVGNTEAAVEVLEKAIDLDRYAEEPYRRLMTLHAAHNRPDAVTAAWRLLHHRLGDLDLDVEAATVRLYRSLTATDGGSVDGLRPIRVLSRGSNSRWSPR